MVVAGILESNDGLRRQFTLKGRKIRAICGDQVAWEQADADNAIVHEVIDRRNALARPGARGTPELLAANLDQLWHRSRSFA